MLSADDSALVSCDRPAGRAMLGQAEWPSVESTGPGGKVAFLQRVGRPCANTRHPHCSHIYLRHFFKAETAQRGPNPKA